MIIKAIMGKCGSGKTTELLKEITNKTLIFNSELQTNWIVRTAKNIFETKAPDNVVIVNEEFSIDKITQGTKTVLIDSPIIIDKKIVSELELMGITKLAYTIQL